MHLYAQYGLLVRPGTLFLHPAADCAALPGTMPAHVPRGSPVGNLAYGRNKGNKPTPCPKKELPSRKKGVGHMACLAADTLAQCDSSYLCTIEEVVQLLRIIEPRRCGC